MQDLKQTGNSNSGLRESVSPRGFLADDGQSASVSQAGQKCRSTAPLTACIERKSVTTWRLLGVL